MVVVVVVVMVVPDFGQDTHGGRMRMRAE